MATRFWLTSAATPYTPTVQGSWNVSAGADIQYLGRKPQGSAGTSSINVGNTSANYSVMLNRFISDGALNAKTMAGTMTIGIGYKESNAALNGFIKVHAWVTQGNSSTVRGTLVSNYVSASALTTTAVGTIIGPLSVTSTNVQAGDRLVVEFGYSATAGATTYNATLNYGNVGTTDISSGSANVTTEPGWIDFSNADGIWDNPFSALTDTFPTIDAKWVASAGVSATGNRARVNCTTATPNIYTAGHYQIQSSVVAFQVPTLPVVGGGTTVNFGAYLSAGPTVSTTNLEIMYSPVSGNLQFRNNVGGSDASPTNVTYNATNHAWWRFRESGGSIYMETSPDGISWTTQRTISTMTQWMLQGNTILYFDSMRNTGTNDYAEFTNVNTTPSATNRCKVWNGSAWVAKPVKVWNGSAWVTKTLKYWNGSTWS